jgi:endonuclease/exonuclease/phosphatase family metal-dependent hydrolase
MLVAIALAVVSGSPASASEIGSRNAQTPTTLRLLAYNIHHGAGNDEALDLERIARLIRSLDPPPVALQEVDVGTARTGGVDQPAELGRLTGMHHVFGPFMDYQGGEYGMAVLSSLPILGSDNHRLPEGPEPRSALAVRVQLPDAGGELTFAGIHFYRTLEERMAQARELLAQLAAAGPVILAGDFNSEPDSPVMGLIGESFVLPEKGGDRDTFPAWQPDREIDYLAFRPRERFAVLESRVVEETVASDHRPVLLVVEIR